MPDATSLNPPTIAALAAVLTALVAELVVGSAWLAARLPWVGTGEQALLREPGARYVRARRRALAEALACAAAIVAGVTAAVVASFVTGTPPWQPPTAAVIALTLLGGLTLRMVMLLGRARHCARRRNTRRRVAQALEAIGGERDRLFHDVADGAGAAIDHVLVGNQGAFAIVVVDVAAPRGEGVLRRNGARLQLGDTHRYIDEATIRRRLATLQHELSKPFGRVLSLRGVLCVPGWRIDDNRGEGLLVVGVSDVVMLQGWRTAQDALMTEDAVALHGLLAERERGLPAPRKGAVTIGKIDPESPTSADATATA